MSDETIPLVRRALEHAARAEGSTALVDDSGELSYSELLQRSAHAARRLLAGRADLNGGRVALLAPPGIVYVVAQWAIWRAGAIAVPLCESHPPPEHAHSLSEADVTLALAHPDYLATLRPVCEQRGIALVSTDDLLAPCGDTPLPRVGPERGALLIFTSGTTGRPKAALSTHAILTAQIRSVVEAWEWSERDRILHALPLHHLHGILNLLCAALWSGATCELLPRFDAARVLDRLCQEPPLTLFMAVPTIYAKLIQRFDAATPDKQREVTRAMQRLRLMVSGSAALPTSRLARFREISGHTLLERYGMTEIGMALGNPLRGERRPGHVGVPFPNVEVRLVDEQGDEVADAVAGRLEVRGPTVFAGYFGKPEATRRAFTADGFFITGDVAVREDGSYRLLGRESSDILKTGGYKVSALEIEEALREHPAIRECAVVGVPDPEWGQRVAAAVVLRPEHALDLDALRSWGKQRLAPYKVPTLLRCDRELPRNAMGKVQKHIIARGFLQA